MSSGDRDGSVPPERDEALERAWREASTERPPPNLDAAIVAAARASVATRDGTSHAGQGRPPSTPWLVRWQPLLAAAGVAGLALVLVPMLPREQGSVPTMQRPQQESSTTAPAAGSAPRRAPITPEDTIETTPASEPPAEAAPERRERAVPAPPPSRARGDVSPTPAPGDVPAQAADSETPAASTVPAPATPSRAPEATAGERAAAADAAAATFGETAAASRDASTWVARIEGLYTAGATDAAARELRAFRAVDPQADAYLPESLRAWARTVQPFPPDPARE